MKENDREERGTGMKAKKQKKKKHSPSTLTCYKDCNPCPNESFFQMSLFFASFVFLPLNHFIMQLLALLYKYTQPNSIIFSKWYYASTELISTISVNQTPNSAS